jgi:hypothetical protein
MDMLVVFSCGKISRIKVIHKKTTIKNRGSIIKQKTPIY